MPGLHGRTPVGVIACATIGGATGPAAANVVGKLATGTLALDLGLCRSRVGARTAGAGMIAARRPMTGLGV